MTNSLAKVFESFCKSFENVEEVSKSFSLLSTDKERCHFVLSLCQGNENKFLDIIGKNNVLSKDARELGNKKYSTGHYDQALEYYTKSIAFAPAKSTELMLALGNRAACLLNLGYIAEALVDVQRALALPVDDPQYKAKLSRRQGVCINRIIESKADTISRSLPKLGRTSSSFDSALWKLELSKNDELGRHLTTNTSIKTGEVLIVEKPYSSVLLPSSYYTHCTLCLTKVPALLECNNCTCALYCSSDCLNKDKKRHSFECQVIERLVMLDIGKVDFLAMRILIDCLRDGHNIESLMDRTTSISNLPNRYEALDIRRVFDLIGNSELRSVADLFRRTFTACTIVEALRKFSQPFRESQVDKSVAAAFILHFLQSVPCNAHEITDVVNGEAVEIGAGIFATLSLLNHSCDPNVVRHCVGTSVILRSIKPIKPGEQIFDNYGYHYATHEISERQTSLLSQYYFRCGCVPCLEGWPLYSAINGKCLFKTTDEFLLNRFNLMAEQFQENFDFVLENKITKDVIRFLCSYRDLIEECVVRPWQESNNCEEALKRALLYQTDFNSNS